MSPNLAVAETACEQSELSFISSDKPHALIMAAQTLVAHLAKGRVIDAPTLRAAMESAFGASDAQGAWCWKDAYDAVEAAQVLFLRRYGPAMFVRAGNNPARILAMLSKIGALLPSETRRSEESHALQQFSTSLEFAYVASLTAGIGVGDIVLEPSAGTVLLAIFAELSGAKLILNEWAQTRAGLLKLLFPQAPLSRVDGAQLRPGLTVIMHGGHRTSSTFVRCPDGARFAAIAKRWSGQRDWRQRLLRSSTSSALVWGSIWSRPVLHRRHS
jgi:hypothetical protein